MIVEVLQRTPTGVALDARLASDELVGPDLLDAEVASVLRRSWVRGDMTSDDIARAIEVLVALPIRRVPSRVLLGPSTAWWDNVTAYDALYLATALMLGATILTVDGPLSRAPVTDVVIENVRVGPPG